MPIYEYHCTACNTDLEEIQKFSDPPLTTCPKCGKNTLHKKMSLSGFQLKGTGWYVTDFRDKDKKPAPASSESKQSTDTNSDTSSTTTETKTTEKKTEDKKSDTK